MLDKLLGNRDFLPNSWFNKLFSRYICGWHYVNPFCDNILFQIGGPDNQFNQSRVPVFLAHTPAGTSTQNIRHWRQMVQSGNTQAYDYGSAEENMKHYSQATAPLYNLSRVSTRVYLYWSDKDWLATETDIKRSLLPKIQPQFLKQNNRLNDYNHFDFIWGLRAPDEIYKPIIRIISAHESRRHAWRYRR
ncbi:unnamed protein product [Anisakis simplex]|uniref:Lipase (inferred by orthology to a zebrafish protein) n=1 Tax=Anisakis simplex TaxID=6269 RepID=A0A0M3K7I7_ANISI|nr:unnamed protein product [Anisakis simplex]